MLRLCFAASVAGLVTIAGPVARVPIAVMTGQRITAELAEHLDGFDIALGGAIIHELGGTRMGNDPRTSVVNKDCQAHDVKDLVVADGGPFVSHADKNPTWTILALAWRTSDFIVQQRKAGAQ